MRSATFPLHPWSEFTNRPRILRSPYSPRSVATALDLRNQPAYHLTEAARYVKLADATLRSWVIGRPYPKAGGTGHFQPLIRPPSAKPPVLSFWNLIEAHVLRSLRTDHGVALKEVRTALRYAERTLEIDRLLLSKELCTTGGELFLDRYSELINLTASGQLAMRRFFDEHLKRVEWDEGRFPIRLFPFLTSESVVPARTIAIDPQIAFGRPVIFRVGVSTNTITERIDAGESVADLAEDYGVGIDEIEQAVVYERAA